nr:uncharacterized protein LOC106044997 isoform X2 [Anser cygnoides]
MRETKLSVRPDGNYHPAVQGVIISLMQYVPSFSDMLTSSRLLFPSPDFPGCHSLLSLKCQRRPRALTALLKPPRCCQNVLEEPEELSTTRYQANGLCTGRLHFFGQGEQAARRAELVAAARAAGELRGLCPVLQQGPRTVPKRRMHVGRTAGSDTEAQHRGPQRISRVRALAHVFQRPWPQKSAWYFISLGLPGLFEPRGCLALLSRSHSPGRQEFFHQPPQIKQPMHTRGCGSGTVVDIWQARRGHVSRHGSRSVTTSSIWDLEAEKIHHLVTICCSYFCPTTSAGWNPASSSQHIPATSIFIFLSSWERDLLDKEGSTDTNRMPWVLRTNIYISSSHWPNPLASIFFLSCGKAGIYSQGAAAFFLTGKAGKSDPKGARGTEPRFLKSHSLKIVASCFCLCLFCGHRCCFILTW